MEQGYDKRTPTCKTGSIHTLTYFSSAAFLAPALGVVLPPLLSWLYVIAGAASYLPRSIISLTLYEYCLCRL